MEEGPSSEVNRFSASQEIPYILWNPRVHYHIHNSPPGVPILTPCSHVPGFDRPGANRTGESTTWDFKTSPVLTGRSDDEERCDQAVVHAQWSAMGRNSIIALFLYRRRKRWRSRLYWFHTINKKKEEFGAFYTQFGAFYTQFGAFYTQFD
jgi:hypothetical protein